MIISGGNNIASGAVDPARTDDIVIHLLQRGFGHHPEPDAMVVSLTTDIGRDAYISMYGPTVGDRIRLGDTALWVEVERDEVSPRFIWSVVPDLINFLEDSIRRRSQIRRR